MQNRNVQIPYELFLQLLQYFLMDNYDGEEKIWSGLEKKLDAMVNREMYSKFKTTPTEEEREKFRQEYLDRKGIQESFRW
ncbi:complexin-2 [Blautia sp.]|uniref:Complexin-2 n=1 Tax=Blautia glucerasea TaxID=536633 RepID=A0A6N2SUA7_9FIRM